MTKPVDVLAIGAHPDDVELGCAGSIALSKAQGKSVAIIDLTQGELGTRGSVDSRRIESQKAAEILGVIQRENMNFRDGFFQNDETHQLAMIAKIRLLKPKLVLCNAVYDRHIDHGKGNALVNDACFLSGLEKIETRDENGNKQEPWRPKLVLEYIQWMDIKPDIIIDISAHLKIKMDAVKAYSTQFYNPDSNESETPISSKNFIESVSYRAKNLGRLIGVDAGEGFTSRSLLSTSNLFDLVR
jgi:bacillithiol biosynthesis deacetylase BshB1